MHRSFTWSVEEAQPSTMPAERVRRLPAEGWHFFFLHQTNKKCKCLMKWKIYRVGFSSSWQGWQTTIHTHIHTFGQFRVTCYPACLWTVGRSRRTRREPTQTRGEHAPHRKALTQQLSHFHVDFILHRPIFPVGKLQRVFFPKFLQMPVQSALPWWRSWEVSL